MDSTRLKDKVAVVTGGASGIGAATVKRFIAEGANVVIADVQDELGRKVAAESGALYQHLDVADTSGWHDVMALVEKRFGRLDIMFNNAGILGNATSIDNIDLDTWNRVIGVNLTGVMLGCKSAITLMRKNPGGSCGSIINTASTTSYVALADDIAYCSTKSAVRMLTKSVAIWCARHKLDIRCNSIHPGAISTAIHEVAFDLAPDREAMKQIFANMSPLGRTGTGDEVAALVAFLASDEASYITAGEYLVDGGALAPHPGV